MLGGGVSPSLCERGAGCLRHLHRASGRTSSGACAGWCRHSSIKHPGSHRCSLDPQHAWLLKPSWGQALSPAGDAKGHLCLQFTKLHSRLFLWGKHWPEETRCQQASVMAVAQAAGTLSQGDLGCALHGSREPRNHANLPPALKGRRPVSPRLEDWCQREKRRKVPRCLSENGTCHFLPCPSPFLHESCKDRQSPSLPILP